MCHMYRLALVYKLIEQSILILSKVLKAAIARF